MKRFLPWVLLFVLLNTFAAPKNSASAPEKISAAQPTVQLGTDAKPIVVRMLPSPKAAEDAKMEAEKAAREEARLQKEDK